MPRFQQKIIDQIKRSSSQHINSVAEFLFLFGLILKERVCLSPINKYISEQYPHNKFQWKTIPTNQLLELYEKEIEFIRNNQNLWNRQLQISKKSIEQLSQQKKRIKKILKQKGMSKDDLIDSYLEQIRRNKSILTKSKDQSENTKFQLNIDMLQKRIQIMKSIEFQNQQTQVKIEQQDKSQKDKQALLSGMAQQFQFKKNFFYEEDIMDQNQNLNESKILLSKKTSELIKKMENIYYHYSKENYNPSDTFQNNRKNLQTIDLRLFLKYYRDFGFFQKQGEKYHITNITNLFKKHSVINKYINLKKFIKIHSELLDYSFKNSIKQSQTAKQLLKDYQILKRKQQLQIQLKKLEQIRAIFSQQKMNKILNILPTRKLTVSKNNPVSSSLNRIIDKTSEDYSKTKQQLYQELKKNKYQKQHSQKTYKTNFLKDSTNSSDIQFFTNSSISKTKFLSKNTYLNKGVFQTIIQQVNYDDDNKSLHNPENQRYRSQSVKHNSKSQFSLRTNSEFTLPKLTRLSDQRIQSQSIYKSLEYLYSALGKKQDQRIKKILGWEKNIESNKIENIYLSEYFHHQKQENYKKEKQQSQEKHKKVHQHKRKCPKFKPTDYEPFMKF